MTTTVFKLLLSALLVDATVALVYLAEKKTAFGRMPDRPRQALIGLVFGLLAVMGTELGVNIGGATLNVRDAAPLCAGLLFGAPAGLLAGLIGGVERWFAVYWGAGMYTRLACSVSTVLAGVFGAALRVHMLDNKKPGWFYALAVGLATEVLHMLMIFLTNMNDVHIAFTFVERAAPPMIFFNALSVMLAVAAVSLMSGERPSKARERRGIAHTVQRWLLLCVTVAFLCTCVFTFFLQTRLADNDADELLRLNLDDVREAIQDASDENLLALARRVAGELERAQSVSDDLLQTLAVQYSVAEIDLIGDDGLISHSTNAAFVGFDMRSGEQSAAFLPLLNDQSELVQRYQPIAYDASIWRKYAGVRLAGGGFVQLGYDARQFQHDIDARVVGAARNRHIGANGYLLICDEDGCIVSDRDGREGLTLGAAGLTLGVNSLEAMLQTLPEGALFRAQISGESVLCMYAVTEGYRVLAVLPQSEAMFSRDVAVYVTAFMEVVLFSMIFALIYFLVKKLVVDNIWQVNRSLRQITGGNLNVTVDVRSNEEFASLSDDINATVLTLKRYIAEAAARIDRELELAREIQRSALPDPANAPAGAYELYAAMRAAREVGGDFYDFYPLGENRLVFLIADVSGKGVPAAMFMMRAKTLLKGLMESGASVDDALAKANQKLCEGNDAGMFVTVWLGVLNLRTGEVSFANAGHNLPLVRRAGGRFEPLRVRPGLVLAGMEGMRYAQHQLTLAPGDTLVLYTDGVTEATDAQGAFYGEARFLDALNSRPDINARECTQLALQSVDAFAGEAPQFDDITLLALRYRGGDEA